MDARTNPGAMNQDDANLYNQGGLVGDNQIIYQAQAEMIDTDDVTVDQRDAQADTTDTNADDPNAIRQNIEQTRSHMSDTIDAIQERLSPQRLVSDAKESVKEATIGRVQDMANNVRDSANDAGYTVLDTVRQNPIPALLAGTGLGWLIYKGVSSSAGRRRGRSSGWNRNYYRTQPYDYGYGYNVDPYAGQPYGSPDNWESYNRPGTMPNGTNDADNSPGFSDRASQAADQIKGKASDLAGNVQDTMGQFTDTVQERAGDFGDTMQQGAYQARDWLQETWQDNPLLLSAGLALVGLGIGLLIKETPQEQQLMGEAHDNLMNKAQGVAQDTAQKVQQVAKTATNAAQDEAKKQGLVGGQQNQSQSQSQTSSR